jgi:EAL domain-containing protein (putative c-di-GMP-specific phosphodiesterase class I)
VERLKIDRGSWPASGRTSLTTAGDGPGIVRAMLAIAESAGMSVVAEGIETEEQRRALTDDLSCTLGHGATLRPANG